ncbi:MAG: hypothetical protein AAF600_15230 [Bacteroidota bacterium]
MKDSFITPFTLEIPREYKKYKTQGNKQQIQKEIPGIKEASVTAETKNKASYKELQNSQKEFNVASMMARTLRQSLSSSMAEICEAYIFGKLTAKFRKLAKMEEGETGTRPLFLSKYGHLLNGFDFNANAPFKDIFSAKYFVKQGSKRGQIILHFPSSIPKKALKSPKKATNFKIITRLIALSDYRFDHHIQGYMPLSKELHGKFGTFESAMFPFLKIPMEPTTGMISVNNGMVPVETGLFLVMALCFYKYENGKFEHLNKSSSMQILQVL